MIFEQSDPFIALAVLGLMLAAFVSERWPSEVIATAGAAVFLALGFLSTDDALAVFSNSAPVTIAALFVLSGAIVQTGVLGALSRLTERWAARRPRLAPPVTLGGAAVFSALLNNTPVVMILMPVMIQIARVVGQPVSRFLIPLSYMAVLGGTCTLIGTSTNILVDGISRRHDIAPFGMFEIAPLGIAATLAGGLFVLVTARWLLPERKTLSEVFAGQDAPRFLTELAITKGSPLIGKEVKEIRAFANPAVALFELRRRGRTIADPSGATLKAYDRLVVAVPAEELLALHEQPGLKVGRSADDKPASQGQLVEALIPPRSNLAGLTFKDLKLPSRYGLYPIGVHRHGHLPAALDSVKLRAGDTILLEGTPEAVGDLAQDFQLLNLTEPKASPVRRHKAPIAIAIFGAAVSLAAFNVMPIAGLVIIAVALVLATGCIESREAWASIDARLLVLIFAMLAVGRGLEQSGALTLIVDASTPLLQNAPPIVTLAILFVLTQILTESLSNSAVAVVVTPLAIGLAESLGLDARPFVVAVMMAASAAFATPFGYQTNTLVYSAGGYRFIDFVKIGVPLNILVAIVSIIVIPMVWPLETMR